MREDVTHNYSRARQSMIKGMLEETPNPKKLINEQK